MSAERNGRPLRQLEKLLAKVNAAQLSRNALTTDTVTELLEKTLGVSIAPIILYQGTPYVYPPEVSKHFTTGDVMQRDIRIIAPCLKTGAIGTLLFARSWIAMDELDEEFRELLHAGKLTIGQILRAKHPSVEYQDLGYREVRSARLGAAFKIDGSVHLIQRSRIIYQKKRPVILIHEFVPV